MTFSTRRIGIVAATVVIVLLAIWYVGLYRPQATKLKSAHRDYAAAEATLTQLRSRITSLEVLERQVPADKARLATLEASVPTTPDLHDVLVQLHNAATATGVDLSSVTPTAPSTPATATGAPTGPQTIQMGLAAAGTYSQIMAFVTQLNQMARAMTVNSVSLSGGSSGSMTANLSASIFYAP